MLSPSSEQTCNCIIESLREKPFSQRNFQEKKDVIQVGRPKPDLTMLKTKTKKCLRNFRVEQYEDIAWLTGCRKIGKLFCWPCILFSPDRIGVFVNRGFSDLNNYHNTSKRHECSENHIISVIQLKTFGKSRIEFQIDEQMKISVSKHNESVKKNREVLKRLIDVTCYLGKQELSFRGHDESSESVDRGNYVELVSLVGNYDEKLQCHLNNSGVFTGLSNRIQNDLIESVGELMLKEIKEEIHAAPFVSVILDETTDVSNKSQLSTVLRYTTKDGDVEERFIGFADVSADRSASALAQHVEKCLLEFDCTQKLIAQTYDGAAVMAGHQTGLQARVKEKHPQALFVHCYAHRLNLVLSQALTNIKECKIFFMTLSGLASFFSKSTKRTHSLDMEVKKRFPKVAPTRWNYNGSLVETVYEHLTDLKNMFGDILENPNEWDPETFNMTRGFYTYLNEFEFNFLLHLFSDIFPLSNALFDILQKKSSDIAYCISKITEFQNILQEKRNCFDDLWIRLCDADAGVEPPKKRKRSDNCGSVETCYRRLYYEVLDNIDSNINSRFIDMEKMKFLELLDHQKCDQFKKYFPESSFEALKKSYGQCFDFVRLRSELKVLYSTDTFKGKNTYQIVKFFKNSGVDEAMPELAKFCELVLTIPASSASAERSFSALKRIKTYLRNSQKQERLSSLSLLSIEKKMLMKLKNTSDFYDKVIDHFTKKTRRLELTYK